MTGREFLYYNLPHQTFTQFAVLTFFCLYSSSKRIHKPVYPYPWKKTPASSKPWVFDVVNISYGAEWRCWLCLLRFSDVWSVCSETLGDKLFISPAVTVIQDGVIFHDILLSKLWPLGQAVLYNIIYCIMIKIINTLYFIVCWKGNYTQKSS